MRKKIVSIAIASAMLLAMAGCGANPAPAEVTPEAEETVTVAEPSEEELEAQKEAEETAKKAEEEAAKAAEEEAAKKAEEERIAALRAEIDAIDTEALASEMTENGNEDGVNALTSLVESYTAGETDPDAFMESYKAILADKEAFDAEYIAEQERIAQEAKEAKPAVTIPDWFDAAYYAANNADVVAALGSSPEALYNHYTQFGKGEGRAAYEGDPNAVAKAESPAPAGETAQTEGGATTQTPWGDLYVIYGEGWDSYLISEGNPGHELVTELSNRVSGDRIVDWIFLGEMNGKHIRKYYVRPL